MADNKETYNSEFKAKVALKALARNKKNLEPLSERYDVPVSLILVWAAQLEQNAAGVYEVSTAPDIEEVQPAPVDIEISSVEIANSLEQGVMSDDLNYKRLVAWSFIGLILVTVFTQMLIEIFQINTSKHPEQVPGNDAFYEVTQDKREARKRLSTYGVMNEEGTIFRVPVDMVIEQMAEQAAPDTVANDLMEKIDPTPVEGDERLR